MLNFILTIIIVISIIYSILCGNTEFISSSALNSCTDAVTLCINLAGAMALWGGVMRVADRCKITEKIARIVSVPLSFLFKGLRDRETLKVISLNVTANLLGLGNAATPLGIQAMKRLHSSHEDSPQYLSYTAMLVLLNTASIQLIPLTTSAMRAAHGAENPWDCVVPTILTSAVSLMFGIVAIKLIYSRKIQKEKSHEHDSAAHNRLNIHHSHGKAC